MDKISLVIVTYNSTKHIFDCLDSVFKFNDIGNNLEVIIVDNASPEQELMFRGLSKKYGNRILMKDSERNGGYGFGNNVGIKIATSDIVIVMNPDVRLVQPIFGEIIKRMKSDCSIGMLGVSFLDGSLPFYIKPENVNVINQLTHHIRVKFKYYDERKMFMSGSFLAFKKNVFMKAGAFDEKIFMYFEEPDITNRIQKIGYHADWFSRLFVRHLAHGREFNKQTEEIMMHSLDYYCKKYNIDLSKNIITTKIILQIKIIAATLFRKNAKKKLFKKRYDYLRCNYSVNPVIEV